MNVKNHEEIKSFLKTKDRVDERLLAFDTFLNEEAKDRIHGLGIKTSVKWVELDDLEFDNQEDLAIKNEDVLVLKGKDVFSSELEGVDKVIEQINSIKGSERIDYLHKAISNLTLVYFKKDTSYGYVNIDKFLSNNSFNHTLFYFGKGCSVNLLYHITSKSTGFVGTEYLNILCDEDSQVFFGFAKDLKSDCYLHNKNFNVVLDNATLNFLTADFGGRLIVDETITKLVGVNSVGNTDNLFYGTNSEEFDVSGSSIHANKQTSSLLTLKGVLEDSRALTRGLVKIEDNAPDSNGYQKSDILLLDDKSKAVSIPDLLIHNDQVKCSHGSTISHLEEDKIFYLQSRGLGKQEAMRKLVEGFYYPVLEKVPSEEIKEKFVEKIQRRIYVQ